jgi:hypothetical protein
MEVFVQPFGSRPRTAKNRFELEHALVLPVLMRQGRVVELVS